MTAVEAALAELKHTLDAFIDLLEREAAALADLQPDILTAIVTEKTRWAEAVNTAWQQLVAANRALAGASAHLDATLAAQPAVTTRWQEIKALTGRAAKLNQGNNVLIEAQMRRTRLALDVLTTAANRGSVYGADGQLQEVFQATNTLDKV